MVGVCWQVARRVGGRPTSYTGSAVSHAPPGANGSSASGPRVQSAVVASAVAPGPRAGLAAKAVPARPPRSGVRPGGLDAPQGSRETVRTAAHPKVLVGGGGGRKASSAQGSSQGMRQKSSSREGAVTPRVDQLQVPFRSLRF